jgi:hypothetical protein
VPLLTIDTSVALPAALVAGSHPRKLWVVLAYGALTYQAEHLGLDRGLLAQTAANESGEVYADLVFDELVETAEYRRTALGELLPYETPDDYVAVGFTALFDEFERKVRDVGRKLDPSVQPDDAAKFRRQFEAICAVGPPPFDPADAPALTRDPEDDAIVYGALLAGCDVLVSDDRDIVPGGIGHEYEHAEHRLRAVTFWEFVHSCFEPVDFRGVRSTERGYARRSVDHRREKLLEAGAVAALPRGRQKPSSPRWTGTPRRPWLVVAASAFDLRRPASSQRLHRRRAATWCGNRSRRQTGGT